MRTGIEPHPLTSPETCQTWLADLPASDPTTAIEAIAATLDDIPGRGSMAALRVLETLRQPVLQILDLLSTRYADKPLPLTEGQRLALISSDTLTRALASACHDCLTVCLTNTGEYARFAALLHQRAMCWAVQSMIEHLRARQRVPEGLWNIMQNTLEGADRLKLASAPVRDALQPAGRSSVMATYVRALMMHQCGARSMAAREFEYARQLAHYFENKPALTYSAADAVAASPPGAESDTARLKTFRVGRLQHTLEVAALAHSLGGRLSELNRGTMFDTPALVPAPAPQSLKVLLGKLYGAWCARANQRRFPRRRRTETVYCAFDPDLIYALMKRRRYNPPPAPKLYSHQEVANIYLAQGDVAFREQSHTPETWQHALTLLDHWRMLEESATGMSMVRQSGQARVRRGQLAAIRLGEQGTALVGEVRWAEQTGPGMHNLEIGLEMLPGLARAGAARYSDAKMINQSTGKSPSAAALILDNFSRTRGAREARSSDTTGVGGYNTADVALPEIDADLLDQPPSPAPAVRRRSYTERATIVLPVGWAREGAMIEFIDGPASLRLRLGAVTGRHGDFERMVFDVVT